MEALGCFEFRVFQQGEGFGNWGGPSIVGFSELGVTALGLGAGEEKELRCIHRSPQVILSGSAVQMKRPADLM